MTAITRPNSRIPSHETQTTVCEPGSSMFATVRQILPNVSAGAVTTLGTGTAAGSPAIYNPSTADYVASQPGVLYTTATTAPYTLNIPRNSIITLRLHATVGAAATGIAQVLRFCGYTCISPRDR